MNIELTVTPRDPIISRDGRPSRIGLRARSLDWIYPSVFAGSLRTLLGKKCTLDFSDNNDIQSLKKIEIVGPLPSYNNTLYFPKPLDCVVKEKEENPNNEDSGYAYAARPERYSEGEGCDMPQGLLPVTLPEIEEFKPKKTAAFWSYDKMINWLAKSTVFEEEFSDSDKKSDSDNKEGTLAAPEQEERIHVSIEPNQGIAKDGMLFSSTGLDFTWTDDDKENHDKSEVIRLVAEVNAGAEFGKALDDLHPLGGERRLVHWKSEVVTNRLSANVPSELDQLKDVKYVRMVLATPAIFSGGWLPGWIDNTTLEGTVPRTNITLKLHGAIVERWRPISGWSYETGQPKAVRRLVPAGSIYFFELTEGTWSGLLNAAWMRNMCDETQDNNDGFGLALWGIWNFNGKENNISK